MQKRFDVNDLRNIPILEVFRLLGETPLRQTGKVVIFKGSDGLRAYPETNTYHCFTGKRGTGDVISLVENYLNTDFKTACNWLADNFNKWQYGNNNVPLKTAVKPVFSRVVETESPTPSYYHPDILKATLKGYESNSFIRACRNVIKDVKEADLDRIIDLYKIGTVCNKDSVWNNACTFPAIDTSGNVHTIQVKQFTPDLHTAKWELGDKKGQKVTFLHSYLQKHYERKKKALPEWLKLYAKNGARLSHCLFGEHLLKQYPNNIVGIVEAPKTAIIATLYEGFPDVESNILWLAVWAKDYLNNLLPNLAGRQVILYPDASLNDETFYKWKASALKYDNVKVSEILCKVASNEDVADYFTKTSIAAYRNGGSEPDTVPEQLPDLPVPEHLPEQLPDRTEAIPTEFELFLKSLQPSYDKAQTVKEYAVRLFEYGYISSITDTSKVINLINEIIQTGKVIETQWQYRKAPTAPAGAPAVGTVTDISNPLQALFKALDLELLPCEPAPDTGQNEPTPDTGQNEPTPDTGQNQTKPKLRQLYGYELAGLHPTIYTLPNEQIEPPF
jgi:hypothetical protein